MELPVSDTTGTHITKILKLFYTKHEKTYKSSYSLDVACLRLTVVCFHWIQTLSLVHEGRELKINRWALHYLEGLCVTCSWLEPLCSHDWPHSSSRTTSTLSWTPWRSNSPGKVTTLFFLAALNVPTRASKMLAQRSSLNNTPNFTLVRPSASMKETPSGMHHFSDVCQGCFLTHWINVTNLAFKLK